MSLGRLSDEKRITPAKPDKQEIENLLSLDWIWRGMYERKS